MKIITLLKRFGLALLAIAVLIGALIAIDYSGGHAMGFFSGSRPEGLGFNNGAFKPPAKKPNSVSSTVDKTDSHYIAPLAISGNPAQAWTALSALVKAQPRTRIVSEQNGYLYAEFTSALFGFVDDVEFALDANAGVIHVRSASRLGESDLNVNRKRIEFLRSQLKG